MYAVDTSVAGDCYLCVPPDPGIEAAALGTYEAATLGGSVSAAPGASASATPGAGESALLGTTSAQAFHTFTLDSGASRSFFRDRTTLTPLSRLVALSLADPSWGPLLASFSTVLPCLAAPSGTLSGLYLPSFSTNLVSGADLQDRGVDQFTPASQRVTHCTCAWTCRHLATLTGRPGSSLYTLTTESPPAAEYAQVAALSQVFAAASRSGPESAPCSCRLLSHQTLLWHHHLGHPSLPCLRVMASRVFVSDLPRSLPPLPPGPGPTCDHCVEGRQRAAPHSSEFPPTEAPLQTLHMDVWGPARVSGQGRERYFLLVVDDYSRYTTVFPLRNLHASGSPQKNGIAERRIGMVMDIARTSMTHAAAPHFLWPFAVQYAAHQLKLQPRVSLPETSPALRWTGKVGNASAFRVWGSRAFVRDLSADKLSPRAVPCVFLGFPLDAPGWQFYHPTSRRVLSSQDITFDESVPYYCLFPYRTAPLPPPPLFIASSPPPVDPLPPARQVLSLRVSGLGLLRLEVLSLGVLSLGVLSLGVLNLGVRSLGALDVLLRLGVLLGLLELVLLELELLGVLALVFLLALVRLGVLLRQLELTVLIELVLLKLELLGVLALAVLLALVLLRVLEMAQLDLEVLLALVLPLEVLVPSLLVLHALSSRGRTSFRSWSSPSITRLLATVVTDPSFESIAASALVAEHVDFATRCRLDYAASLVAGSESVCPPSIEGECALSMDVLEDKQEEFQCFGAALPHLVSTLIAPEGDPDAPDIPTPRSYSEAIEGPYSSQWHSTMDAEMASWKSTSTYVDKVSPPWANIVSGMWIFRVKRPPGSPPVFKARYVARGFCQRQGVDYFQTFSPTPKMTTFQVLLHIATQCDYELHSLDFSTAFLQGSLHEEIWLRCPLGFTGSFPPGTQCSLRRPVYGLRQAPREWHDTLRTTLAALGFAPSTADPSLFLRTDTSLPPF
ncbi:unnamed protein product [Closterium sp. NIES-64]|nr:unnamed protein product [Closterium sp. NIES-64]